MTPGWGVPQKLWVVEGRWSWVSGFRECARIPLWPPRGKVAVTGGAGKAAPFLHVRGFEGLRKDAPLFSMILTCCLVRESALK